jgi:hypothetical protein
MAVPNTLAYYNMATITAIKTFIMQALGVSKMVYEIFLIGFNGTAHFKKCKQWFEYHNLLPRDIWWSKF